MHPCRHRQRAVPSNGGAAQFIKAIKDRKGNDKPVNSIELPCGRSFRPARKKKRKVSRIQMEGIPGTAPDSMRDYGMVCK